MHLRAPPAVKVLLQHIALAHRDWLPLGVLPPAHQQSSQLLLRTIIGAPLHYLIICRVSTASQRRCQSCAPDVADGMRMYFLPPRFYSTEFPYAGLKLKMVRGLQLGGPCRAVYDALPLRTMD